MHHENKHDCVGRYFLLSGDSLIDVNSISFPIQLESLSFNWIHFRWFKTTRIPSSEWPQQIVGLTVTEQIVCVMMPFLSRAHKIVRKNLRLYSAPFAFGFFLLFILYFILLIRSIRYFDFFIAEFCIRFTFPNRGSPFRDITFSFG